MSSSPVCEWLCGARNKPYPPPLPENSPWETSLVYPLELRATRFGLEIELSPREIAILELLHQHTGQVVTRNQLLDRCWGIDYFPESRTVDQHIAKLRKRIETDPPDPQIIETVRNVGYRYRC